MKKISLIIPIYNGEKFLRQCLNSAIGQTYENFEIIVIDDGSTDRSYEICKEFQKQCNYLKIIHRLKNRGLVYSWKEGVYAASGSYIAFLDCDDWVDSAYLKELARGIQEGAQIVCCNYNKVFSDRQILRTEYIRPGLYDREQICETIFPVLLNNGSYLGRGISPHRCGKLFCKQLLIDNLQYCDEQITYGEDLNIFFAVMMDCHMILILDDCKGLYFYRQNEESIIYTYKKAMFQQISLLRKKLFEIMEHKNFYDFSEQLNADFWCLFLEYLKNETKSPDLVLASKEVCMCCRESRKEIPYRKIKLKPMDYLVMLCLRCKLYSFVYIWMVLYHFVKKR